MMITTLNWDPDGELKRPLWARRNLNRLHTHGPSQQPTTDPDDRRWRQGHDEVRHATGSSGRGHLQHPGPEGS